MNRYKAQRKQFCPFKSFGLVSGSCILICITNSFCSLLMGHNGRHVYGWCFPSLSNVTEAIESVLPKTVHFCKIQWHALKCSENIIIVYCVCIGLLHSNKTKETGSRLNIKTVFPRHWDSRVKDKMVTRPILCRTRGWDKRRGSEIDLSQPRNETDFWWRHNGPVTSPSYIYTCTIVIDIFL